jgi:hypothetical protein
MKNRAEIGAIAVPLVLKTPWQATQFHVEIRSCDKEPSVLASLKIVRIFKVLRFCNGAGGGLAHAWQAGEPGVPQERAS